MMQQTARAVPSVRRCSPEEQGSTRGPALLPAAALRAGTCEPGAQQVHGDTCEHLHYRTGFVPGNSLCTLV